MKQKNIKEIDDFIHHLKERDVPVIIEYKNDTPSKIFYRLPKNEWLGIAIEEEGNKIFYRGLTLFHLDGIVYPSKFVTNIKGESWCDLKIEDIDIYVERSMRILKNGYNYGLYTTAAEFDLETDIVLKDLFMDVYCKQQTSAGVKIVHA